MLSTDFETSRRRHPELAHAFDEIQQWVETHSNEDFVDFPSLARSKPSSQVGILAVALAALVEDGIWCDKVAVIAPTNYAFALDEEGSRMGYWDSEEEIPGELYDSALTPFNSDEGEIVSVYRDAADE